MDAPNEGLLATEPILGKLDEVLEFFFFYYFIFYFPGREMNFYKYEFFFFFFSQSVVSIWSEYSLSQCEPIRVRAFKIRRENERGKNSKQITRREVYRKQNKKGKRRRS